MDENKLKHLSSWDGNAFINRYGSYAPWYDDKADYNTNAKSYYDYLTRINQYLKIIQEKINELIDRDIKFNDSNTVDFITLGKWLETSLLEITAKVNISPQNGEYTMKNTRQKHFNTKNGILEKIDGIWSNDYAPVLDAIDDKLNSLQNQIDGDDTEVNNLEDHVRPLFKGDLQKIRNEIKSLPGKINIGHMTDNHYVIRSNYWGKFPLSGYGYSHIFNIASISDLLNTVIAGGDNCDESTPYKNLLYREQQDFAASLLTYCQTPAFLGIGNHDDNSVHSANGKAPGDDFVISNKDFENLYFQRRSIYGEVRNNNSNYFYYDIKNSNVRVIWVDLYQNPYTLDDNKLLKYPRLNTTIIQNDQLQWLANTAMNTDRNLVIFTHCPVETIFDKPTTNVYNHDAFLNLLSQFQAHESGNISGSNSDFPVNVNYNFNKVKGKIIGVFSGHKHKDAYVKKNNINFVLTNASVGQEFDGTSHWNTNQEDSWSIINIDEVQNHVKIIKFERGKGTEFDY